MYMTSFSHLVVYRSIYFSIQIFIEVTLYSFIFSTEPYFFIDLANIY